MKAIETRALTKYYGVVRGIDQLDLIVERGTFFGFIGPNGAGKSTTIRTLLGLISPDTGTASVLGMDIRKQHTQILKKVGYLPSEAVFYNSMRVKDVLKLSADLRKLDCGEEANRLCSRLELDVDRKVEDLSFGNRKKVGIVCALQHQPELLILDEPTSGLDPLMQREFFEILQERNEQGATIFLSSHVLSEIQRNCSHAAIIRQGRIVACGSVDDLSGQNVKRVTLRGNVHPGGLQGVRDLQESDGTVSFLYSGELNPLLKQLSAGKLEDLTISEPDLEEVFLHYYEKGDGDDTDQA